MVAAHRLAIAGATTDNSVRPKDKGQGPGPSGAPSRSQSQSVGGQGEGKEGQGEEGRGPVVCSLVVIQALNLKVGVTP